MPDKHNTFTEEKPDDKMALQRLPNKQKKPPVGCYYARRGGMGIWRFANRYQVGQRP